MTRRRKTSQPFPFAKSLIEALPYSSNRNKAEEKALRQVNNPTFFQAEKKRVLEIQNLITDGKHSDALKELLIDTHVDNPIKYYNKIRNGGADTSCNDVNGKTRHRTPLLAHNSETSPEICQWTGYNKKHDPLVCSNIVYEHKWKHFVNVFGQRERVKSDVCLYHQKYCVDENQVHGSTMMRITIPNEFGLCSDCNILKLGLPPSALSHYPGQRLKYTLEERRLKRLQTATIEDNAISLSSKSEQALIECRGTIDEVRAKSSTQLSRVVAATIIRDTFQKSLARIRNVNVYNLERVRNRSAVQIQTFFRYYRLRGGTRPGKLQVLQITRLDESIPDTQNQQMSKNSDTTTDASRFEIRDNVNGIAERENIGMKQCQPCSTPETSRKRVSKNNRREWKCDASACQICHAKEKGKATGRPHHSIYCSHLKIMPNMWREVQAMLNTFRKMDRFGLGSLPRNQVLSILEIFWEKAGQPMLPQEKQSIINAFECRDGRDGHLDYVKYVTFASQQTYPCSIHSRIVCPDEACIQRSKCNITQECSKFEEDPLDLSFCVCGRYKSRHNPFPLTDATETRKRGFNVFSRADLKRTFGRRTNPDTKIDVDFVSLEDAVRQRTKLSNKLLNVVKKPSSISNPKRIPSKAKSGAHLIGKNLNHISTPNSSSSKLMVRFSPERLGSMMDKCVEYKHKSIQPKSTTPCPLCKLDFYSINLLQNHLKRRHTIEEINYSLFGYHSDSSRNCRIHVEWVGLAKVVPPLPPPVSLNICNHHVPPHPKCAMCRDGMANSPLFPPIRFYDVAFMERRTNVPHENKPGHEDEKEQVQEKIHNFHFNLQDKDLAVVLDIDIKRGTNIGYLVALCEDGRGKFYVGVQYYLPTADREELTKDSEVHFVPMKKVIDRKHIFHCTRTEFLEKKQELGANVKVELKFTQCSD